MTQVDYFSCGYFEIVLVTDDRMLNGRNIASRGYLNHGCLT
jgi:hypothetical protein